MAIGLAGALLVPAPGIADSVGANGAGDPLFPKAGNGGYDVGHYDLRLKYDVRDKLLRGIARISATSTQELARFNLDLRGAMRVARVQVDGRRARFRHGRHELVITPADPIGAGAAMEIRVRYRGNPEPARFGRWPIGWLADRRGAFVLNEPDGAPTWFPCNDHPSDKAAFRIRVTVPRPFTVASNGELVRVRGTRTARTFTWTSDEPMATYLASTTIGRFRTAKPTITGLPSFFAWSPSAPGFVDPRDPGDDLPFDAPRLIRDHRKALRFLAERFGPHPFASTGAIVYGEVRELPVALEVQPRPLYQVQPTRRVVVHELAHQWFGNSVTLSDWGEPWLNEGFATWSEWLWGARGEDEEEELHRRFMQEYGKPPDTVAERRFWQVAPAAIDDRRNTFHAAVYSRGAMTLQALYEKVGATVFYDIIRAWASENAYSNVTTADFIALAELESGLDLDEFFDVWLYRPERPTSW